MSRNSVTSPSTMWRPPAGSSGRFLENGAGDIMLVGGAAHPDQSYTMFSRELGYRKAFEQMGRKPNEELILPGLTIRAYDSVAEKLIRFKPDVVFVSCEVLMSRIPYGFEDVWRIAGQEDLYFLFRRHAGSYDVRHRFAFLWTDAVPRDVQPGDRIFERTGPQDNCRSADSRDLPAELCDYGMSISDLTAEKQSEMA